MPHADAASVPASVSSKADFYAHLVTSLEALFAGDERSWVVVLSNAASVIYNAMAAWDDGRGRGVNWAGFYLLPHLFPAPPHRPETPAEKLRLLLGPFQGRPACQHISLPPSNDDSSTSYRSPIPRAGVCAHAFLLRATQVVPSVEDFPGHIACDAETKSELVVPLVWQDRAIGVLDLDCTRLEGFDDEDQRGLEAVADLIVKSCDWW